MLKEAHDDQPKGLKATVAISNNLQQLDPLQLNQPGFEAENAQKKKKNWLHKEWKKKKANADTSVTKVNADTTRKKKN